MLEISFNYRLSSNQIWKRCFKIENKNSFNTGFSSIMDDFGLFLSIEAGDASSVKTATTATPAKQNQLTYRQLWSLK